MPAQRARKKQPTQADVARRAGVSKATVSAVINDSSPVSDTTRERVRAAIESLNYRRAATAGAAAGAATAAARAGRCIAIVIKEIDNPYYAEIVLGARSAAHAGGYTLLVVSSEGEYDAERRAIELLQTKAVDGMIATPVLDADADLSHFFDLKRRNVPFVLLEDVTGVRASLVDIDNAEGSRRAVQHLIELGHTRIVHFAGPKYSMHSQERIAGVHRAYSASHLVFHDEGVVAAGAHMADGYRAALAYFGDRAPADRPTAVTCYNDLVALGVYRALTELGLRVPDDVSVVGFDGIEVGALGRIGLTTVAQPRERLAEAGIRLLLERIDGDPAAPSRRVLLDPELIVRRTTKER